MDRIVVAAWGIALGAVLSGMPFVPARAQEARPRVAVLDFQAVRADEAEATAAADRLRDELVNLEVFTVLDRTRTEALTDELAFQQQGFTDPARAAEVGRMLNVQYIITGRLTRLEGAYQASVQMIEVQSGRIERSESVVHRGAFLGLLTERVPRLARRLARVEEPPPAVAAQPGTAPAGEPSPSRWGPMGMMHGAWPDGSAWPVLAGGALVMGSAMASRHADEDTRSVALVAGGIGVGLILYGLLSAGDSPDDAAAGLPASANGRPVALIAQPGGVRAALTWRW